MINTLTGDRATENDNFPISYTNGFLQNFFKKKNNYSGVNAGTELFENHNICIDYKDYAKTLAENGNIISETSMIALSKASLFDPVEHAISWNTGLELGMDLSNPEHQVEMSSKKIIMLPPKHITLSYLCRKLEQQKFKGCIIFNGCRMWGDNLGWGVEYKHNISRAVSMNHNLYSGKIGGNYNQKKVKGYIRPHVIESVNNFFNNFNKVIYFLLQ